MKVFLVLILTIIVAVQCVPELEDVNTEWSKFKEIHGKTYKNIIEEQQRKFIFKNNYQFIKHHNEQYLKGEKTFYLKINQFADMTAQERKVLNGFRMPKVSDIEVDEFTPNPNVEVPESFDWRDKNAVTGVKDQAACASCWAFSSTGSLETQYFLKTGKLVSMSEQNLVDCSHEGDNHGCHGGWMTSSFEYVYNNDGIDSEESYPYEARDGVCRYKVEANITSAKGYANIKAGSEDDLKAAVAQAGSISVAIDATSTEFYHYGGGIFYLPHCKDGTVDPLIDLDHAVLVVGYGTANGFDYWIVKNSWSDNWGDSGYIKMSRNRDNNCGIATMASFPLLY